MDIFPQSDDLSQALDAPVDHARAAKVLTAPEALGFIEPCQKCRGTGRVRWGRCFSCNGKGKHIFKTSPQARAADKANRERRAEEERRDNLKTFAAEHPDLWAWMDGSDFPFALAMKADVEKYGSLTVNKLAACYRCVEALAKARAAAEARKANAQEVNVMAIEAAFSKAAAILKAPRLKVAGLVITRAKPDSKNPGALYVKADGEYMGKIMGGRFECSRACGPEEEKRVLEVCADPKGAAIAYGRLTGRCAICSRVLTKGESVERGIGPICAEQFGW